MDPCTAQGYCLTFQHLH